MKGDMEVEVLSEDVDTGRYERRMKRIVMTPEEQELYAFCPERAKANKRPGYPADDDSGYGDTQ
jgi:hypothetical protein